MEREMTCCFTGHRPDKLPWGTVEEAPNCLKLKECLYDAVERAYQDGYRHFICGMARGADFYFGESVILLREKHSDVTLEAARPCDTQADGWPEAERRRYEQLVKACDFETLVQHHYDRFCMARRNQYMVDRSRRIIAVYDGIPKGGTAQTLMYAMRQGLETEILPVEREDEE